MDEVRGSLLTPDEAMRLAISEAEKGAGFVSPNPLVGCVIVDHEHRLLAKGYHRQIGQDHAEIDALKNIPDKSALKGARLYVTLEPCAHQGRTPSCALALAKLPIRTVVYGMTDPFPEVSGKGAEILRAAGMEAIEWSGFSEVESPLRAEIFAELEEAAEFFLHNQRRQRPFVGIKAATSLDGMMALRSGDSKWITDEEARLQGHYLRGQHDATLIGRKTFFIDNPYLNVRHPRFPQKENKVVLLNSKAGALRGFSESHLYSSHQSEDIILVVSPESATEARLQAEQLRIQLLPVPLGPDGSFKIDVLLVELWRLGVRSVLVEGGAVVIGSFLRAHAAQRLHLFIAPVVMGATSSVGWTETFGIAKMNERLELKRPRSQQLGRDIYLTGKF